MATALVIGGTGPTGHYIVSGLRARGYTVAILHTGNHEIDETPADVKHIHTNPYDANALEEALAGREFDLCVAAYGRLRVIAELMRDRCQRFISVGGQPCYIGYMHPGAFTPAGLPVPVAEDAPLVTDPALDEKGYRIVRTEKTLFEAQPGATHLRYPMIYGKYQAAPREWCIVKRILDKRPHIILPDGGLTLMSMGYAENMAHALLLAVDKPSASCGQIYNCADVTTLTLRQTVEIIADGLGHQWEVVNMPWSLAKPAAPLIMQPQPTHRVIDTSKLQQELGYRDLVEPAEALVRTARGFADNPPADPSLLQWVMQDPFDYDAEDRLIGEWQRAMATMNTIEFAEEPGYGMAYSGPGGRERSNTDFDG